MLKALHSLVAAGAVAVVGTACSGTTLSSSEWQERGRADGYAVVINAAQVPSRATAVWGTWDNPSYAKGYALGANAAVSEIRVKGCSAQACQDACSDLLAEVP